MEAALLAYGLPGLFVLAFLAGSVFPFPTEGALVALLAAGGEPIALVAGAAAGNVLGAGTLFWLGRRLRSGLGPRVSRWRPFRISPEELGRGLARVRRWGPAALFFSWLPVAGDLLVVGAGAAGAPLLPCAAFTIAGKTLRFAAVAWLSAAFL